MDTVVISVWRRTGLITLLASIGALMFIPLLLAGSPNQGPQVSQLVVFPAATAIASCVLAFWGFRWNDQLGLAMPLLRPWEAGRPADKGAGRPLLLALACGVALGLVGLIIVKALGIPPNPGSLAARASSTLFAAVVTETAAHLFLTSALLKLFPRRKLLALVVSAVVFVLLFHGSTPTLGIVTAATLMGLNFAMAMAFGAIYLKVGFEAGVVTHAASHLLLLSLS